MSQTAITTSVRYVSDGTLASWPVPFPFVMPAQLGVKIVNAEGQERRLAYGTDYLLSNNCVMAVVPLGQSIVIWLDAPLETVLQSVASRAANPMPPQGAPSNSVLNTLTARVNELEEQQEKALEAARKAEADAQVQRLIAEGETQIQSLTKKALAAEQAAREVQALVTRATQTLTELAKKSQQQVTATATAAQRQLNVTAGQASDTLKKASADAAAQLSQKAFTARKTVTQVSELGSGLKNYQGFYVQAEDMPADQVLTLPDGLVYYPGRAMLVVIYQGTVLSLGVHYDEVGDASALSDGIMPHFASKAGDQWGFIVIAANSAAGADIAAKRAEEAAREADADAKAADTARNAAELAARKAGLWQQASEYSADEAYRIAQCAWKAAYQASMATSQPGIAAVRDFSELSHCVSGLYIINRHLLNSPTLFMGVWPVDKVEDITWDGVFFFGPQFPSNPTPPPVPCPPPGQPGGNGSNTSASATWKPCNCA